MSLYKKIIIGSCLGGIVLAFLFYKDIKKDVIAITNNDVVNLFQVGVYENITNANKKLNEYVGNVMIKINDYYHVISGICYNENTCNILKNYFNNKNINYYIKKYKVSNNVIKEINNYEIIINNTTNYEVIDSINKKINTLFVNYLS